VKAQFKYAFRTGLHVRGLVFAIIFVMNLVFIILGALGWLPFAAQVTAVALGGVAIGVMTIFNIISDVSILSRMFTVPGAYLHALTPAPRKQILLSSVITMMILDIVTMAVVITGEVLLSLNLAGSSVGSVVWTAIRTNLPSLIEWLLPLAGLIVGYLLVVMIILSGITLGKSVFYQKKAGGLMTAVAILAIIYVFSVSPMILAPLGTVSRFGFFFTVTLGTAGTAMYILLTLIQTAVLFVLTSKLMERKLNI